MYETARAAGVYRDENRPGGPAATVSGGVTDARSKVMVPVLLHARFTSPHLGQQ